MLERMHNLKSLATLPRQPKLALVRRRGADLGAALSLRPSRKQSTTRSNLAASQQACKVVLDCDQQHEATHANRWSVGGHQQHDEPLVKELALEAHHFRQRHIGPREKDICDMLNYLGFSSLDQLIQSTIPNEILLKRDLRLPEPASEHELLAELKRLAEKNQTLAWKSYVGQGYYDCVTPAVIMRNIFENPGWTTAYTAYQAEIAQGRLESLMNYQTMVSELTGLDVANASLLDEATAAAEAIQVAVRWARRKNAKLPARVLISNRCHKQTLLVINTRLEPLGISIDYFDELQGVQALQARFKLADYCALLIQYPNTQGHLFELGDFTRACHESGCLSVVATDLLACALFKPPGDFEHRADLSVGSSQRLGIPLNFGGPHAAFLACQNKYLRLIPGRVVGATRDSSGALAYRLALQTREQHIKRDKATSNICTAQALLANMSAMYAIYHGPEGLRQIAGSIHAKTSLLAHLIAKLNQSTKEVEIVNEGSYFDTLTLRVSRPLEVRQRAQQARVNLRYQEPDEICLSLDETTSLADVFTLAHLFAPDNAKLAVARSTDIKPADLDMITPVNGSLSQLKRTSSFLTHPTFNSYRSEAQLVRYMKQLENKDISLVHSMIPLGSCTMKLNATSQMIASSWPEFAKCHPYQPLEQSKGYLELFEQLEEYLCEITGYDRISFQPNSGAQGEYAGLRAIKAYLDSRAESQRNICLIPISAHGTNPASAQMAGFTIVTIKVNENGSTDLDDLRAKIDKHRDQLACLMITYPSTFGVFEADIVEICRLVHQAGGQVYLDGANMNAQVGLCRPGDYGSDVSHLNLHKTFCIPHGGGGPGAGPIGVKAHLAPFLPADPLAESGAHHKAGPVSAANWGSAAILPISWSYIRLMGRHLKLSSEVAILNANYMRKRLEGAYKIVYKGQSGNVAHEFILDCRPFKQSAGIEATDIAKRLQDYGFHSPTLSWPVANTLMLEPTESEDKQMLDRYCDALLSIRREIEDIECGRLDRSDNPIKNAPHSQQQVCSSTWNHSYSREVAAFPSKLSSSTKVWPTVGRVDDTYGDTNLFCSCPSIVED